MTPDELAKSSSEHGHQRALFAWAAMAEWHGFEAAWLDETYSAGYPEPVPHALPELRWLHAIPNGGDRKASEGAKLKAEGVKRGVLDVFLPLPMWRDVGGGHKCIVYCGLYIEMKRPETTKVGTRKATIIDRRAGGLSTDQEAFTAFARRNMYAVGVYFDWRAAAKDLQTYVENCKLKA